MKNNVQLGTINGYIFRYGNKQDCEWIKILL